MAGMVKRAALLVGAAAMFGAATLAAAPLASATASGHPASPAAAAAPLKGYRTVVGSPVALPANAQRNGAVQCPAGTVPLGGGVFAQSTSPLVGVNSSFPTPGGWAVDMNNGGTIATSFKVRVICAAKPANYVVVQRLGQANPVGQHTAFALTCPLGTTVLSGGAASNSASPLVNNSSSAPTSSRTWQISENNGDTVGHLVSIVAVCGSVSGYGVVHGPVISVPGHGVTNLGARCPAGVVPVGGGAVLQTSTVGAYLNSSAFAASNNWVSAAANTSAAAFKGSSTVVCAKALE